MKPEYLKENSDLFKVFLEKTFFYCWRNSTREKIALENFTGMEMSIGYECSTKCKYCYYNRYGKELHQNKPVKAEDILSNTEKLMNFIVKNNMLINLDVFSGDPFSLPYIWEFLDILIKHFEKLSIDKRSEYIAVPTNMSIVRDEIKLNKLKEYRGKFKEIGIDLGISASIDGPFMDNYNRPFKNGDKYNKEFYDKVLSNAKDLDCGFHPMIYSNNIEYWIENFLWFYYLTNGLYLLEVRNAEWSKEQCLQLFYFLKFVMHFIFNQSGKDIEKFKKKMEKSRGFNILFSPFTTIGRGLGCSLQSTLNFQMNDLTIIPCHRTSYEQMATGKFIPNEDGSYDFLAENVEFYLAEEATQIQRTSPCISCNINTMCSGGCLGSNFESSGEAFVHHPNVCRMEHYKVAAIVKAAEEIGLLNLEEHSLMKQSQMKNILEKVDL